VVTIKPGFVDTPMTREFKKSGLWEAPENVAQGVLEGIARKRPTVYLPRWWWAVMKIISFVPETIFSRIEL
jgi:short-subunit dehydrogenase